MSVLIKGMTMPKNGETITITICDDGIVFEEWKEPGSVFKAIPVPSHGRLIDADAFEKENEYFWNRDFINPKYEDTLADLICAAPTVIEAEEAEP